MQSHVVRSLAALGAAFALLVAGSASADFYIDSLGLADLGLVTSTQPLQYDHSFDPAIAPSTPVTVNDVQLAILLSDDVTCLSRECLDSDGEWAVVDVAGSQIYSGQSTLMFLFADVTVAADITHVGDSFGVSIQSVGSGNDPAGDFLVLSSIAKFDYSVDYALNLDGGSSFDRNCDRQTEPVPEPSAALVFGAGLLAISGRLRRRA